MMTFKNKKTFLPADLLETLVSNLAVIQPGDPARNRIRANLLARIRTVPNLPCELLTVRSNEGEWTEIAAGVHLKNLVENNKMKASVFRMMPGSEFPGHDHSSDEECICLQGEVSFGDINIKAGDFHLAPCGVRHGTVRTTEGCLLYVRCAIAAPEFQ